MKRYRRGWKTITSLIVVILLTVTQTYATSMEDAEKDKEQAEENKSNAEQIRDSLSNSKSELESYVAQLDLQLTEVQAEIEDLHSQKAELENEIEIKQTELEQAKLDEKQQYADMCARIQFMYENDGTSFADALFTSGSMNDILNQPEYVSAMADYDYNMLDQLVATREQIANDEHLLEIDLEAVENLTSQAEDKENEISTLIDQKSQTIAEYEDQISRQEKLIAQYDAELQAATQRIAELEAAAAQSAEYVPYSGGPLLWPCPSSTRITSYFGYRTPDGGYVNANHKGVDIGAPTGTPAIAAASGVVVIARYSNSAGNWVVISHGNGMYTMYMHASQLCVSEGQYVNAGDTILLVGSTGWSTGPHLHFGVGIGGYLSANAVDPLSYFQ
ncbi:MAG: peptidoglycan DD-metalloendopeptidase family protein [Lachnospiraceae bacterium]|nr:peptidoglycan DD-metalloendopeptidase family protein [Lachnospiraceae bacterium]